MKNRSFLSYIVLFLKGLAMGTANKIPGISGGMIALVGGFYEELMYTFQKFNPKALALLRAKRWRSLLNYLNYKFLLAVNLGMITAFFTISLFIDFMMNDPEEGGLGLQLEIWSFFFGLILGSIYYIWAKSEEFKPMHYLWAFIGAALGLWLSFLDPLLPNHNTLFIIFCGFVSVSGMALPGFSGSFLLIIFGNYNLILVDSINALLYTVVALLSGEWETLGTTSAVEYQERLVLLKVVGLFILSSIVGLVSFSKVMTFLLKRFHNAVIATLLGFIVGSLGAAWPWKHEELNEKGELINYVRYLPALDTSLIAPVIAIIIGVLSLVFILQYEKKQGKL